MSSLNLAFSGIGHTMNNVVLTSLALDLFSGGGTGTVFGNAFTANWVSALSNLYYDNSLGSGNFTFSGNITVAGLGVLGSAFTFNILLGNEVRTVIPEPSTGLMVAMGLGLLGIAGSGRRIARKVRGQ